MKKALIIVDIQHDFVEGGSLAVNGGMNLADAVDVFLENNHQNYAAIVTTQDWHINPEGHWSDNPDFVDTWPVHCKAETFGSEICEPLVFTLNHMDTNGIIDHIAIHKGEFIPAYSGFEGHVAHETTLLVDALKERGIGEVDIVGIATDYCVKATAEQALEAGFTTNIIENLTVGINQENCKELFTTGFANLNINVK